MQPAVLPELESSEENSTNLFPILHVLTQVLVHSLCPLLKTEVIFGEIDDNRGDRRFNFWSLQNIVGDFSGQVAIGSDQKTLENILKHLNTTGTPGVKTVDDTACFLTELITAELCKQFQNENFVCKVEGDVAVSTNFNFTPPADRYLLCPVESKFGILNFYFLLNPSSTEILEELDSLISHSETRKIRVYAYHLDMLGHHVQNLEKLEERLLSGPHIRSNMRAELKKLKRVVHHLKTDSLENLFTPARSLVADIAKQEGKQVRLVTRGTWLYLDKTLLNYLYEPILHLIRNAVDHGIEEPRERERQGKNATGTLRCLASFNEIGLRFIISDDGRGLDFPKIRSRAVARGLLSEFEAQQKLSADLCSLVFEPGFSTRDKADAISGRGLGLDIVRKRIEGLGGTIRFLSTSHHGSSLELAIPLEKDFVVKNLPAPKFGTTSREEEEKGILTDELSRYLERLPRTLVQLRKSKDPEAAYEAFRLTHSIKGVAGFLGWNRVTSFCHHFEDLLKLLAEQRIYPEEGVVRTVVQAAEALRVFCEASVREDSFSLFEVRRIEGLILQTLWTANHHSEEKTQFYFGKFHLGAIQKLLDPFFPSAKVKAVPDGDFKKALEQPYGALVQFGGDRRGYAGLLLPQSTFEKVIYPFITGAAMAGSIKDHLWTLGEFASLMGVEISQMATKTGVNLAASAPLTYYGWGQPLRHLGNPTYCYSCEIKGNIFYLAGDFRTPYDTQDRFSRPGESTYDPSVVNGEALIHCQNHLAYWNLPVSVAEVPSQSDLIGFDGGVTAIISCVGSPSSILFLSFENSLASYLQNAFSDADTEHPLKGFDLFDCLNEIGNTIGGQLIAAMEKRGFKMRLSLPSVFIGKAYVANFNRLFINNKYVGTTPKGKFELQVLVTKTPE